MNNSWRAVDHFVIHMPCQIWWWFRINCSHQLRLKIITFFIVHWGSLHSTRPTGASIIGNKVSNFISTVCLQFLHNFQFCYFSKHEIFMEWILKQQKVGAAFNPQSFLINMSTMNLWKSLLFSGFAFRQWDAIALLSMSKLIIWFACIVFLYMEKKNFTWKKNNSLYSNDALRTGERT